MTMPDPVVLINAFEVPAGEAEQFIAAWEKSRDFMRSQPGYIETALHQALMPGAEFLFVNVARWQTAEDFTAAARSSGFLESVAGLAGYRPHPGLYRVIRT
jgi:heme-degrading monooxygenase HmoA